MTAHTGQKSFVMNQGVLPPDAVGSPPQVLDAVPDTGSFEMIISSSECEGCAPHKLFDRSKSSTFQPRGDIGTLIQMVVQIAAPWMY